MGVFVTEVRAVLLGKQITAINQAFEGAKLYIDGEVADSAGKMAFPSRKIASLLGRIVDAEGHVHVIEVYIKGFLFIQMRICVDGERVAGY